MLTWLLKIYKDTNLQVLIIFQHNWLKQDAGQYVARYISLLILIGIRTNCLNSGRRKFFSSFFFFSFLYCWCYSPSWTLASYALAFICPSILRFSPQILSQLSSYLPLNPPMGLVVIYGKVASCNGLNPAFYRGIPLTSTFLPYHPHYF